MHKDYDPVTGIIDTTVHDGKEIKIKKYQDVTPFLEENSRDRDIRNGSWKGDFHKVASIPPIVIEQWVTELKAMGAPNTWPLAAENNKFFMGKLNDPEYAYLRTKEGRI